jgi:glycosyltransferase involved in cell wall biosynthesis
LSSKPAASVIIPLYQDAATIGACLDSLSRQTIRPSLEIIVVDDGSNDGGDAIAASYGACVIRQSNAGPGAARNSGAAAAAGDVLLFMDADCVTAPDWAERIVRHFDDPTMSAVLCPLEPSTTGLVPALVQSELDERYERLRGRDRFDFLAGSFAVRASAFAQVGGFHEGFRYNEDVELAFSLNAAGHKITLADGPPVRHAHYTAWRDLLASKFWRGVWRMRLYRAFPEKRWADSWTPPSLKIQIAAVALIPLTILAALFVPRALWLTAALMLIVLGTGVPLLRRTSQALKAPAGAAAPLWASLWVFARAATLAASIVYAALVPWRHPPMRHARTLRFAAQVLVLGLTVLAAPPQTRAAAGERLACEGVTTAADGSIGIVIEAHALHPIADQRR